MDQNPLVKEEIEAGSQLVQRLDRSFPVKAAFWVKGSDEQRWYLYIASDHIQHENLDVAYGEVLRQADQIASPYLDPFQVKLIPASEPIAQAVQEIQRRYPGSLPTRLGVQNFGGMGVDGVYIYPESATTLAP